MPRPRDIARSTNFARSTHSGIDRSKRNAHWTTLCAAAKLQKTDPTVFNPDIQTTAVQTLSMFVQTNPAPQNARTPQHGILTFSLQAQLQPVMMQKCITSFFSQEYCFAENPGLSASSGRSSAHSLPSEFLYTRCSVLPPNHPGDADREDCCPMVRMGYPSGRGLYSTIARDHYATILLRQT